MGWKCRSCGSRDVFAAVIGEEQGDSCKELKPKLSFKDSIFDVSLSPGKKSGSKYCLGVATPCDSQFKVLGDLMENSPSFDYKCSSCCSSPFAACWYRCVSLLSQEEASEG